MKHVKKKPPELCEQLIESMYVHTWFCHKTAKYERLFDDPKAKPMRLCGNCARQAKRRGYTVKSIGE